MLLHQRPWTASQPEENRIDLGLRIKVRSPQPTDDLNMPPGLQQQRRLGLRREWMSGYPLGVLAANNQVCIVGWDWGLDKTPNDLVRIVERDVAEGFVWCTREIEA